ncbi:MAG TPA: DNA glycosylase [Sulfurospirillum sp. UBA12182]|jgi:G:T/U-mismatch repair DNA glycosylase|nr:MAG TPA: DNA glycosylase [Sulfurospirillum sp. UBA12182]
MFRHFHPYEIYIPQDTKKLIIGTLPPPRFCTREFKPNDVDFPYGSEDGLLWKVLDKIYSLDLEYNQSITAIQQRKEFLMRENIGICDIVSECKREKINALDSGMREIIPRDILKVLREYTSIHTLIFTGVMPRMIVEKILNKEDISFTCKDEDIPQVHEFFYAKRVIKAISLTSPSPAANRSIGANKTYKKKKSDTPMYNTFDFRVEQYEKVFKGKI